MTETNVPLRIYSRYVWTWLFIAVISYIAIVILTDKISGFIAWISVASSMMFGHKLTKESMIYRNSKEV